MGRTVFLAGWSGAILPCPALPCLFGHSPSAEGRQSGQSGEIAGGHCQGEAGADPFDAAQHCLGHTADCPGPTEGLPDFLSAFLRAGVTSVASGSADGGMPSLAGDMRGDAGLPECGREVGTTAKILRHMSVPGRGSWWTLCAACAGSQGSVHRGLRGPTGATVPASSVYLIVFIQNLPVHLAEKILPMQPTFRWDYPSTDLHLRYRSKAAVERRLADSMRLTEAALRRECGVCPAETSASGGYPDEFSHGVRPSKRKTSRGAVVRQMIWKLSATLSRATGTPGKAIQAGIVRPSRARIVVRAATTPC